MEKGRMFPAFYLRDFRISDKKFTVDNFVLSFCTSFCKKYESKKKTYVRLRLKQLYYNHLFVLEVRNCSYFCTVLVKNGFTCGEHINNINT